MLRHPFAATALLLTAVTALAESYSPPKTYFGQPDLQGTWTNATFTTLERPDDVEALVLTESEARAMVNISAPVGYRAASCESEGS